MKAFKGPKHQRGFLGLAALAISAVSTGFSMRAGAKASKAGKAANETQKKINRLRNKQAKRNFLRNFRQSQANNITTGIASGAGLESSRVQGTASSEKAQANLAVTEFAEFDRLGEQRLGQSQSAADYRTQSGQFAQVASFASSFVSFGKKAATGTGSAE